MDRSEATRPIQHRRCQAIVFLLLTLATTVLVFPPLSRLYRRYHYSPSRHSNSILTLNLIGSMDQRSAVWTETIDSRVVLSVPSVLLLLMLLEYYWDCFWERGFDNERRISFDRDDFFGVGANPAEIDSFRC